MKLVITWCLLSTSILFAGPQAIFEKANTAYAEGNYTAAKDAYELLVFDDKTSAELFYNLGNTYFKLGENAKAILYYEKAKLLSPFDEDIQHNLEFANQFVTDKKETTVEITNWWTSFLLLADVSTYTVMSLLVFFLAAFGFMYFFLSKTSLTKQFGFYSGTSLFTLFILVWVLGLQRKSIEEHASHAIIMKPTVSVLTEPTKTGKTVFTLHSGSKIQLIEKKPDWSRISFTEAQQGWVKNQSIEEI